MEHLSLSFEASARMGKEQTKQQIHTIAYPGGGTNTGTAIDYATTYMRNQGRLGQKEVYNIAFVITDGKSGDNVENPADVAKNLGITIYAIGVGNGIDFNELNLISNDPSRVFQVSHTSKLLHIFAVK